MDEQRRKNVLAKMEEDSVFIIHSGKEVRRNHDTFYPFRASSHFYYLTSLNIENSILILDKKNNSQVIYVPYPTVEKERWQGTMLKPQQIADLLCIPLENVISIELFFLELPARLKNHHTVYYDFGEDEGLDRHIISSLRDIQRKVRQQDFAPKKIIHCEEILQELRLYKMADEIENMRKAASISAQAHKKLMLYSRSRPVWYEYELRAFLHNMFEEAGASTFAYSSIVAIGANATFLHYARNSTQSQGGELLLVDAGCEWKNYSSDITRTFPLNGKFTSPQKEIYHLVWQAQQKAFQNCKPNSTLSEIHFAALETLVKGLHELGLFKKIPEHDYLKKKNTNALHDVQWFENPSFEEIMEKKLYSHFYMHMTSHFMGLDVHDNNIYFAGQNPVPLQEGMVFSVEPGLYFPCDLDFVPAVYQGIGVRIEDTILIHQDGHQILTADAPTHWQDIENLE